MNESLHAVSLPTSASVEENTLDKNFHEMVGGEWVSRIQSGTEKAKAVAKDGGNAISKIFGSLGDITKLGVDKTTHSKSALTILSGGGAAISGIFAVKSILKTLKTFFDPKGDNNSPWLVHGLMSILQGGLAVGLAAPFTGGKSPFMKVINGQNVVPLKMILGAVVGIFGLKLFKDTAAGVSIPVKLPFVGKQLKEIAETVNGAVKSISTNTGEPGAQGLPAGINPAQFAQAA